MTKSLSGLWSNFLIIFSLLFRHVFSLFPVQEFEIEPVRFFLKSPNSSPRKYQEIGSGWFKYVEALVEKPPQGDSVLEYLTQGFELNCTERESSLLYGDGCYFACENPTIRLRITLVETWWLGLQIPRIYRKRGWYYVKMIYPEDQEYESALKRCHAVDAKHYKIQ